MLRRAEPARLLELVDDDEFEQARRAYAAEIAAAAPIALGYMKAHIERAADLSLGAALDLEAEHLLRCAATEDHREGVTAFLEKRAPRFVGR